MPENNVPDYRHGGEKQRIETEDRKTTTSTTTTTVVDEGVKLSKKSSKKVKTDTNGK